MLTEARLAERARTLEPIAARRTIEMAAALRAEGREVLSLYGSPHWLPPEHVLETAEAAVRDNAGAPPEGLTRLREAVAARLERENDISVDPLAQVLVTNAANHGLYVIFSALLDQGDEVVTASPHYYYQGIVHLAGGRLVNAPTRQEDGWAWDMNSLRDAIGPRTKVLVVNTPTNPTGYVGTRDDMEEIAELAAERDLLIVSDEAYDHTIYDGRDHISIGSLPAAAERTLTVISCTKSYAMRHWRVGFLACPPELFTKLRDVLEWNCFQCNHVAQHAALAALEGPQEWVVEISTRFERCRGLMTAELAGVPGLSFADPQGGPFLFLNVGELAASPDDVHRLLLQEHGVPTDPGGPFGSERHLRLPFGGEPEDVSEAGRRIAGFALERGVHG